MQSLDDDQAVELMSIPLAGKSSIADHMVIASGRSSRQVASMATKLADKIKQQFGRIVRIEGLPVADWVLIDADDVIVHLFRPDAMTIWSAIDDLPASGIVTTSTAWSSSSDCMTRLCSASTSTGWAETAAGAWTGSAKFTPLESMADRARRWKSGGASRG